MKKNILTFIVFSLLSSVSFAADFNVATTQEFRAALSNSAANGESDTINLAAGTYKTSDDGLGTFTFLDNEGKDLWIRGADQSSTILSGNGLNSVLEFNVLGHDSLITLDDLSVTNGAVDPNSATPGGILSRENLTINRSTISFNEGNTGGGVGIIGRVTLNVNESTLSHNKVNGSGGAIHSGLSTHINLKNSTINQNEASFYGGGISCNSICYLKIESSTLSENFARVAGGAIMGNKNLSVLSTYITGNRSTDGESAIGNYLATFGEIEIRNSVISDNTSDAGKTINLISGGSNIAVINTVIANNDSGISLQMSSYDPTILIGNTVFFNNASFDLEVLENVYPTVKNSYLTYVSGTIAFSKNNLNAGNVGFYASNENDFRLTENSILVDAGENLETLLANTIWGNDLPLGDIAGNQRISGASIDIGPYEFSTTRPTITKFDVEGVRKVDQVLSFVTDATASSGRTITSYEIDNGSGAFVSASSEFGVNYLTSGQRLVRVKVTDDQGEWSAKSLTISIADLTLDEKIVAATEAGRQEVINSPSTYGLALASEIPVAREAGRQDVISSPSTYDLALASEIPVAREEQIAACLASPSSCGINIPNADIDGNGTQDALTDGLLILRYSFGLTGDSLIGGVVAEDATRTTAEEIEAYLATLMPSL